MDVFQKTMVSCLGKKSAEIKAELKTPNFWEMINFLGNDQLDLPFPKNEQQFAPEK